MRGEKRGDCSPATALQHIGVAETSTTEALASRPPCDKRLSTLMPTFSSQIWEKRNEEIHKLGALVKITDDLKTNASKAPSTHRSIKLVETRKLPLDCSIRGIR